MLKLHTYFRSTAAYRVRIALNYKELDHELIPVHLLGDGGEHKSYEFLQKNPNGLIPVLEVGQTALDQSLVIMEYLEDVYPENPILPADLLIRARVRAFAQTIACDIHPLNNLRVLNYLTGRLEIKSDEKNDWYRHWIKQGFTAIETRLRERNLAGAFCFGSELTIADFCLIPQVYNAKRFHCPLDQFPLISSINEHCLIMGY